MSRNNLSLFLKAPQADPSDDRVGRGDATGLIVAQLAPVVQDLFAAGLAHSTQRTYQTGERRYIRFCQEAGLTPFPAKEKSLILFAAHLFQEGLLAGTVKSYLSAVRHTQITLGLGDPRVG